MGYLPLQSTNLPTMNTITTHDYINNDNEVLLPIIANFTQATARNLSHHQHWLLLHSGVMHSSSSTMKHVIQKQLLNDIHPKLLQRPSYDCPCMVCKLSKPTLIPRGKLVDKTILSPFQRLHVDFSFFSVTSIRGFTSGLDVTCASTSYPFSFPTKSKAPPVDILQWVLKCLRNLGYEINFIRVDEGGELARSSIFTKFVCTNHCILETTGGGNSCNNGVVERGNRTKADMVRSQLSTMNILMKNDLPEGMNIEKFWCFAYTHSSFVLRRTYNRMRGDIPYFLVHGERPSAQELIPLGAIMTIIDPHKSLLPKLSRKRAEAAYFLGYANHSKIRMYWSKSSPMVVKRSAHNVIEDIETMKRLEPSFIETSNAPFDLSIEHEYKEKIVTTETIDVSRSAFHESEITKVEIKLPLPPTKIGLKICDDDLTNMPYIQKSILNSYAYKTLKRNLRHNQYLISINGIDYLTATQCISALQECQQSNDRKITLELADRTIGDSSTPLLIHRAMFDQLPHHFQKRPVIASTVSTNQPTQTSNPNNQHNINDGNLHYITAAAKPKRPSSIFEALKTPFRNNWKAAAWNQFKKNKDIVVFSLPFPSTELPDGARVFRSQLIPEIKTTDAPGIYELKIRDVIVGTPQQKYIDYDDSYAPIVDPCTIKLQIVITCGRAYFIGILDVKNAFQNTIAKPKSRIYTTVPPTYLEWLAENEDFHYDKSTKYYRQMLNSNQGTRDAGNLWYCLMRSILEHYGFIRSTVDHAFFVKALDNGHYIYASVATDDIMCSFHDWKIFEDIKQFMLQYFELSTQTGAVLKFLGMRIIQSDHGISMDQAEYTYEMLQHYFGTDLDKVKTHKTPLPYDKDMEKELRDAIPIQSVDMPQIIARYKGPYRFWIGKLLFLGVNTRFEIVYSVQRLSEYNNAPTIPSFDAVVHLL